MSAIREVQKVPVVELATLLDAGDGAVVTLLAGETQLAAHKAVLTARSPVFAAMFEHDTLEASSGQVTIADVEGPVLRQLLAYCYTLQAPQLPSMAPELMAAADKYGLSGLKDACGQQVAAQLAVENAAAAGILAVRHLCPSLTAAAVDFIRAHSFQVMATQGWAEAVRNQPEDVIALTRLLSEPPPEERTPATATRSSHYQPNSDHGTAAPAPAATPTATHHTAPPDDAAIASLRSLSQRERDSRLMQAVARGAVPEMRALLAAGASMCPRGGVWTALHCAAFLGREEAVRCLVEVGAHVDAMDLSECSTPLHKAAKSGHAAVVRLLLAASANPNARTRYGMTPLHSAAMCGQAEAAAALLEGGADRGATDDMGRTPLDFAREHSNNQQLIQLLTP